MCDSLNKGSLRRQDFLFALIFVWNSLCETNNTRFATWKSACAIIKCELWGWFHSLLLKLPRWERVSVVTLGDDRWLLLQAALNLFAVRAGNKLTHSQCSDSGLKRCSLDAIYICIHEVFFSCDAPKTAQLGFNILLWCQWVSGGVGISWEKTKEWWLKVVTKLFLL